MPQKVDTAQTESGENAGTYAFAHTVLNSFHEGPEDVDRQPVVEGETGGNRAAAGCH